MVVYTSCSRNWLSSFLKDHARGFIKKALLGSAIMGSAGIISTIAFKFPYALGTGYEAINNIVLGKMVIWQLIALLLLKILGTSATMAAGGIGGIFIPMIMMGATVGAAFGAAVSSRNPLYPILGMAAFLGAGYNTPLAAATFIAESTGSPGFIIPGLIAAAVSYTVSGRRSVSMHQRSHKQTPVHKMLEQKVGDVMTTDVVIVPASASIERFVYDYLLKYRHKSFPVANKNDLLGMVALCDLQQIPHKNWSQIKVGDIVVANVVVAHPHQNLSEISEAMGKLAIDRLPVVDPDNPTRIPGVIASTDLIRLEELASFVQI